MTTEELYMVIIVLLGFIILLQIFFMFLMKVRMRQITFELEALTRNVEAFKRLKI